MHRKLLLCCLLLITSPLVAHSNANAEFIDLSELGIVNWSRGIVSSSGQASQVDSTALSQSELEHQSYQIAFNRLITLLHGTRINSSIRVVDYLASNNGLSEKLNQMVSAAAVMGQEQHPDGTAIVSLQFRLRGGFAQLLLPSEIKQVEPIKAMSNSPIPGGPASTANPAAQAYTGLIVDARGTNVRPAMVPLIVDEGGRELYGPAFISREYAVQYGVCQYVCDLQSLSLQSRVGSNALMVKALRAGSEHSSDLVISNKDAAKLRDVCENLNFLKQCRVVVIMDCVHAELMDQSSASNRNGSNQGAMKPDT